VIQYNPSHEVVIPVRTPSDPSTVLVPAGDKYAKDLTFRTASIYYNRKVNAASNYLTIVAKTAARDNLTLDGTLIS